MLVYPAIFYKEKEGSAYFVEFKDFDGVTGGRDINEAMYMAIDLLGVKLYDYFVKGKDYPEPSDVNSVVIRDNEDAIMEASFISLVAVDMKDYLKKTEQRTVRKNVTIPSYLNEMAKNMDLNVSKFLKEALEREFEID